MELYVFVALLCFASKFRVKGCQEVALGMESGAITNGRISASSQANTNRAAKYGRLQGGKNWAAKSNDNDKWLQVDLGDQYPTVTRVGTQGSPIDNDWVITYKLEFSNDAVSFTDYMEQGQTQYKEFTGNTDQNTVVSHDLNPPITARYVRFRPITWEDSASMRVELYGCAQDPCSTNPCQNGGTCNSDSGSFTCTCPAAYTGNTCSSSSSGCWALGMESGAIPDGQITASSRYSDSYLAEYGRLHGSDNWAASSSDDDKWLQVDLGDQYPTVSRVATQGNPSYYNEWVETYKLDFSNDEVNFEYYIEQGQTQHKVFNGNTDRNSVVSHDLNPPITARYIRFRPVTWNSYASMRVELYGCPQVQGSSSNVPVQSSQLQPTTNTQMQQQSVTNTQVQNQQSEQTSAQGQHASTSQHAVQPSSTANLASQQLSATNTQVQQQPSVQSSAQGQHASTSQQAVQPSSTAYLATQQHSATNTQVQNQQSVQSSAQGQHASTSQQAVQPSSTAYLATQQHSATNSQVQQQSVQSSAQGQHASTSQQAVQLSSTAYLASQPHSATNSQVQQQSVQSSAQGQQASTSQQTVQPSSTAHLATQQHSATNTQVQQLSSSQVQHSVDPCSSNPCQNGGTCNSNSGNFTCTCPSGYTGDNCSSPVDPCSSNPCENSGTCNSDSGSFTCTCPSEYIGDTCSTISSGNPCIDGIYQELTESDRSVSSSGVTDKCDGDDLTDWSGWYRVSGAAGNALASNNPPQSGTCGTGVHMYLQADHPSFSEGEVTRVACASTPNNPCNTQRDIQVINCGEFYLYKLLYWRDCHSPWRFCTNGQVGDRCAGNQCLEGQQCALTDNGNQYQCVNDPCSTNPCQNGGTCHSNSGSFTCTCPSEYAGDTCDTSIPGCQEVALGMETGAITDNQITASSEYNDNHTAENGRLQGDRAWIAGASDVNRWLQVDLGDQYPEISRVATQGSPLIELWVTEYKMDFSNDGMNFQYYTEQGQTQHKLFTGNTDQNTVVSHDLNPPITARYVRFRPITWNVWLSMRVELYGCPQAQGNSSNASVQSSQQQSVTNTQVQNQQSSAQVQNATQHASTSQQAVQPLSTEHLASQQHSVTTPQVLQQSSAQAQNATQYASTSQQAVQPSSVGHFSAASQQHSVTTAASQQQSAITTQVEHQQSGQSSEHGQMSAPQVPSSPQAAQPSTVGSITPTTHRHSATTMQSVHAIQSSPSLQASPQMSNCLSSTPMPAQPLATMQPSAQQQNKSESPLSSAIQPSSSSQALGNGSSIIPPVHGNWSSWSPWPNCNKPCNGGVKIRKRMCDNPEPAFGGNNCTGPATESEPCNLEICPADELNFQIRFIDKSWSSELEDPNSQVYQEEEYEIQQLILTFYQENGEHVSVEVLSLRNGSIIGSVNVSYPSIDLLQIVVLQEELAGGTLGNTPAELLNITSTHVPDQRPVVTKAESSTSTSIDLEWTEVLDKQPILGYVIVYKEINENFRLDAMKSVAPTPLETVLEDLKKFTNYTIRVYAFTSNGNGISSEPVSLRTQEDVPSQSPPNTNIRATSSTTIEVRWQPINQAYVHGILLGYEVRYAKHDELPITWETEELDVDTRKIVLGDLAKFSPYKVVVCAKTSKGCGKEYTAIVRTWDDVPDLPPHSVTAQNLTSEKSIDVSWGPVPDGYVNGILLGYSLKYQRILTGDWEVDDTEEHTLRLTPSDLSISFYAETYSLYRIQVAAFTRKGMGPFSTVYAETCRCPSILYTNYWSTSPYLRVNENDKKLEGIFSGIVTEMIYTACGICPGHGGTGHTKIDIISNGKDKTSAKKSVLEVLNDIDDVPQISFPIYGNKYITRYMADYAYINLVESPGVAFIAGSKAPGSAAMNIIYAVLDCVPMIVLSACMAYISGCIIWFLDSKHNPDEFPRSFFKGVGEGFWWSFISMTTVGYGDRSPRSIPARIFGIVWTLTGLVIISILIGAIASSLTSVTVEQSIMLYGTKIGAIQDSVEHRLGILKNAKVNEEKKYSSVEEIRTALEDGQIDGALIDTYVAAEHKETLLDDKIFVKKILDRPFGYGVVLSGAAVNVEERCRDYINLKISEIFKMIQNMTKTLDAPSSDAEVDQSIGLFDSSSDMFRMSMISLLGILGLAVLLGLSYHFLIFIPRRNKVSAKELEPNIASKLAHKDALVTELREFVESFYSEMSKKISSIKKEQRRALKKETRPMKYLAGVYKWAKRSKNFPKDVNDSNITLSSYASKEHNGSPGLVLKSVRRSQEQHHEWELPNTPVPNSNDTLRDSYDLRIASNTENIATSACSLSNVKYKESTC